ncbi:hypothetical protein ACG04R_16820 [Roseateles sp. BYS78W]|uniref:Uncharacterized protein n=1 Tax=Pelomonas candidula TaxID=3299025 RepID=A0ABW7HEK3_9BURK
MPLLARRHPFVRPTVAAPVAEGRDHHVAALAAVSRRGVSRWLLLNYPLLWRARPTTLLLLALAGHVIAGWAALQLPTATLWDGDLQFHAVPLAYAWALTLAVFILVTRRMAAYRDAGERPRQRLATLALSLGVVVALAWPADHFQQVVMRRQVEAFSAEDAKLVRQLAALQDSLVHLQPVQPGAAPACAGWPAALTAASAAERLNDLLHRNRLVGSLDEKALAAALAGQHVSCGGADAPTVESGAYDFIRLSLERPLQYAGVREQLDAHDWPSALANHMVALALLPLFWAALVVMSQPRRPPERRWLGPALASLRSLARWPRLPLAGRLEDYQLRSRPAWWALWPLRMLLLSTLICVLAGGLMAAQNDVSLLALLFGGLLYLCLGIALVWRCHDVPLCIGRLSRPGTFVILIVTTLLPVLPFAALVLCLGASTGSGALKGGAASLAIALYYVAPHLLTACLVVNVVRARICVIVAILGVLITGVVAGAESAHAPFLAGWLLACAALSLRGAVPRRTGRQFGRALVALVLWLAPAALVAAMMLASSRELAEGDALRDAWVLASWWVALWLGPVQCMRRVLACPGGK